MRTSVCKHRWKRRPDERPDEILRAALEVFSREGFRDATMDEIARAAGITKGTIYLYFTSKEELFLKMVRQHFDRAFQLLPEITLESGENLEVVARRLGKAFLNAVMTPESVKVIPLIIGEMNHLPALRKAYHEEVLPNVNIHLGTLLELGMQLGWMRPMNPIIAARCLAGMFMVFVLTQEVFGAKEITPMSIEEIVETIVSIYFRGCLQQDMQS